MGIILKSFKNNFISSTFLLSIKFTKESRDPFSIFIHNNNSNINNNNNIIIIINSNEINYLLFILMMWYS